MTKNELVGFARKSNNGGALKLSLSREAFNNATEYKSQSGEKFVPLIINMRSLEQLLSGEKEVTSVIQIEN